MESEKNWYDKLQGANIHVGLELYKRSRSFIIKRAEKLLQ